MTNVTKIIVALNLIGSIAGATVPTISTTEPLEVVAPPAPEKAITSKDVETMIPTNMQATTDASSVGRQIADKSMDTIMNSDAVKNTGVAKVAQNLNVAADMKIGTKENGGTEHKIGLRLLALQTMARVEYSGFLNAEANYSASSQSVDVNLSEKLTEQSKLLINMNSQNQIATANIHWDW